MNSEEKRSAFPKEIETLLRKASKINKQFAHEWAIKLSKTKGDLRTEELLLFRFKSELDALKKKKILLKAKKKKTKEIEAFKLMKLGFHDAFRSLNTSLNNSVFHDIPPPDPSIADAYFDGSLQQSERRIVNILYLSSPTWRDYFNTRMKELADAKSPKSRRPGVSSRTHNSGAKRRK